MVKKAITMATLVVGLIVGVLALPQYFVTQEAFAASQQQQSDSFNLRLLESQKSDLMLYYFGLKEAYRANPNDLEVRLDLRLNREQREAIQKEIEAIHNRLEGGGSGGNRRTP